MIFDAADKSWHLKKFYSDRAILPNDKGILLTNRRVKQVIVLNLEEVILSTSACR